MAEELQQDIYNSAIADAPVEETPVEAPVEAPAEAAPEQTPAETPSERPRDEFGRFAKTETPEPKPETRPEPVEHRIPLAELLNEREKRQSEQRRAEMLMRELEQLKQQVQAPPPQPVPDQFQNPDAYNEYWAAQLNAIREEHQASLRNMKAEWSMHTAHREHKEVFEQAYQAVMDRAAEGDRTVAQMVANAPDPGQAMVNWYKREQTMKVVGDNPQAYVQKALEEALENPEFLAKALEKAKGIAAKSPTQVSLPPSLNKATSSGKPLDTTIMSDAQLYQHSIGR